MYKFSQKSKDKLATVKPQLRSVMYRAMEIMNERNANSVDFGVSHGLRTDEEQAELYAQGRTKPGNIVTNCDGVINKSKHQDGNAVDVYAYVGGTNYDSDNLNIIACCVLQAACEFGVKVQWGGHFKSMNDSPHFELIL